MPFNFPDPAVSTTTTNPVTGVKYQWKADPGKWVLTGGPADSANPPVTISLLPPEGPQKGDLWIHEESLVEYAWDGTQWFEVGSSCGGGSEEDEEESDLYVKKTGDTMTGTLVMESAELDFMISGESLKDNNGDPVLDSSGKEKWDDSIDRFSHIESLPPRILRSDGTYGGDTSGPFGIRVEIDDGNTHRNRFVVGNRNGDMVTFTGGTGPAVEFGNGFPGNQDKVASGDEGKVRIKGIPTPDFLTADNDVAVNKRYVDERDELLRQDIIELEEEIDAIAPSVERGSWEFTLSGDVGSKPGKFTAYDEFVATSGTPTGLVQSIKSLRFNTLDNGATPHGFENVEADQLLELFVAGSPDYGLFEVVEVHDYTASSDYWVIDVNFVRTLEATTRFDNDDVCRLKIASAPSGGTSDLFVLKAGDKILGELWWGPYKPAANGNPAENVFSGINVYARAGGTKHLLYVNTGGQYSPEELSTDVAPTVGKSITNKAYVDGKFDFSQYPELT